jgi:hypothetical protein
MAQENATGFSASTLPIAKIHGNQTQEMVFVPVDRLQNILNDHASDVRHGSEWHTPAATSLAVVATLLTATFQDAFGLKAAFWHALFALLFLASVGWLIAALVRRRKAKSVAELVDEIKRRA